MIHSQNKHCNYIPGLRTSKIGMSEIFPLFSKFTSKAGPVSFWLWNGNKQDKKKWPCCL